MFGQSRRFHAMVNARKEIFVRQVLDPVGHGEKLIALGDRLLDCRSGLDETVRRRQRSETYSYSGGPVEEQPPGVGFFHQRKLFLPVNRFQSALALQVIDGSEKLSLL